MDKLLDVDAGVQLHQQLLALKQDIGLRFLEIGRILYRLKEEGLYQVINPDMGWEAYLAQPEVSISPSHARNLIRIYRTFVLELQVEPLQLANIDQRKLTAIVPVVTEDNVEDKLHEARALTRADLVRNLKADTDHEHEWERISFERCAICYEERERNKERVV